MTRGALVTVQPSRPASAAPWRGKVTALPGESIGGPEAARVRPGELGVRPIGPGLARWSVIVPAEIVRLGSGG